MTKLIFQKLQHKDQINDLLQKSMLPENKKNHYGGVYVWGFLFDCHIRNGENILEAPTDCNIIPTDFKGKIFIPYYTGQSSVNIFRRLSKHHLFTTDDANKYIRISEKYMNSFFLDEDLKDVKRDERKNKLIASNNLKDRIAYFNNRTVLEKRYKDPKIYIPENWEDNKIPINKLKYNGELLSDPLMRYSVDLNNFWVTYAKTPLLKKKNKSFHKKCESYTYWSLKGVTLSNVQAYEVLLKDLETPEYKNITIDDEELMEQSIFIFKYENGVIKPNPKHEGY